MEDFQNSQNKNSCSLSMPEGLKDLMFDISREVLRAQPENICQFVADYLSAMLVARDSLHVASHLCEVVCDASAPLQLHHQLKQIHLTDEQAAKAQEVINEYLQDDEVAKESLSARLMEVNIGKSKVSSVKRAVEAAFKRRVMETNPPLDLQFSYDPEAKKAAANTLNVYCKSAVNDEEYYSPTGELKVPYEDDNENSSDDLFDNIQYDGGIQDLYVSGNSRPYKNSSLTSLAGSYGLAKRKLHANSNVLEKEDPVTSYNEKEKQAKIRAIQKLSKRQVHLEPSDVKNSSDDEIMLSVDYESDNEVLQEECDDCEDEVIEEDILDAENDSEVSIEEESEQ